MKKQNFYSFISFFNFQEAKDYILPKEKLGDTRAETKAKKAKPSAPKRSTTIKKAIEEGMQ